jgi:NhaP-type Na+/H+ or K+/H+ antiporter
METALIITVVGFLVFCAHLFAALFEKTRIPDVLPLVFIGLALGPISGLVHKETFGQVGDVFTSVALVVILFESGLGLQITVLRRSMVRATRLTIVNFLGAVAVMAALVAFLFKLNLLEGLLFGSILAATAPAVVIPMAGKLPLAKGTRTTLILESIFGEGLCIVLTLAFLHAIQSTEVKPTLILGEIISSFLLAAVIGAGAAYGWSKVLHRIRQLENSAFTTPAFVFIVYGIAEMLGYIGPIAAFAFGIVLGNIKKIDLSTYEDETQPQLLGLNKMEKAFYGEVVFLLKTFFFVYIGLSARLDDQVIIGAGLLLTAGLLLVRVPIAYFIMDRKCTCREAPLVAAMIPRGLAAAVLASIVLQADISGSSLMNDLVYIVITVSVIATTIMTFMIEKTRAGDWSAKLFGKFAPVADE